VLDCKRDLFLDNPLGMQSRLVGCKAADLSQEVYWICRANVREVRINAGLKCTNEYLF